MTPGHPLFHLWIILQRDVQKNQHILPAAAKPDSVIEGFLWIYIFLVKLYCTAHSNPDSNHKQSPPSPTHAHSQHDRIAGVCLVSEEKWAEIRSCDPPVCLRLSLEPDSSHTLQTKTDGFWESQEK